MKKILIVSLLAFTGLFVLITWMKERTEAIDPSVSTSALTPMKKDSIRQFWALYKEATTLRMDEQWQEAADKYTEALSLNDQHEDALYYLGNMHLELGQYKAAETRWEQLIHVHPKNSRAYMQLADLYLNQTDLFDIDKAEGACLESLKYNKEETGPVQVLGEVNLIRGRLDEAAKLFESVFASNFKSTEAYFFNSYIAWKQGDVANAERLYNQAVKYAQPADHPPDKVLGEGDTKNGKGFGSFTSKSVFHPILALLKDTDIQPERSDMERHFRKLDILLIDLRNRIANT